MDEPDPSMHATPFTGIMIVPSTDRTVWDTCSRSPIHGSLMRVPFNAPSWTYVHQCARMH